MNDRLLEHLRKVYLKAEIDIINEIARLRSRGLIDYHAVAALKRVQQILRQLQDESWTYIPRLIEEKFYVNHPDYYTRAPKSVLGHLLGYKATQALTIASMDIVARLTAACMGSITEASDHVMNGLTELLIGREENDIFRYVGLEVVREMQATGQSLRAPNDFVERLRREGVTAFVDKAGRAWNLHTYADMVIRTTSLQASHLATLTKDPEHDLYMITKNNSGCKVCAPLEGRVYSKSGTSPYYPPLADAFGKRDKNGPNTLENTYLTIHPNCRHSLLTWSEEGKSMEEIEAIRRFSNPKTNPYTRDPRSQQQITAYRNREKARQKLLDSFEQFEKYRLAIPDKMPKTWQTFDKHKKLNDEKYKAWVAAYKEFTRNL